MISSMSSSATSSAGSSDGNIKGFYAKIMREFGLELHGAPRREKTGYVCACGRESVIIQKPRSDKETLLFAHFVKEGLHNAGLTQIDRFITAGGKPFCEVSGELFTVSAYMWGGAFRELRFDEVKQVVKAADIAGQIHAVTSAKDFFPGADVMVPKRKEYAALTTEEGFTRQRRTMQGYKKIVKKQSRLSDFDVKFLKSYDSYETLTGRALDLLQSECGNALQRDNFSHNLLKEETLLANGDIIYVTCFDECSGDHFLFDLASIIKRFLRMAKKPTSKDLHSIVTAYTAGNPLDSGHMRALHAILLYPDKFIKTMDRYYSKKRSWIPASFTAALEVLDGQSDSIKLIDEFFL